MHSLENLEFLNPHNAKGVRFIILKLLGKVNHGIPLSIFRVDIFRARSETEALVLMREILWTKIPLIRLKKHFRNNLVFNSLSPQSSADVAKQQCLTMKRWHVVIRSDWTIRTRHSSHTFMRVCQTQHSFQ